MKIAVIGATGFIGRHLCDTCIGRGDSVSALVRSSQSEEELRNKGISTVMGDILDEAAITRTCSGANMVFNLAGALGKWNTPLQELQQVNAYAAGLIVRCAAKAGVDRVVHTSTAGVSGPLPDGILATEDDLPHPITEYQYTKLGGEHQAQEASHETGMPLVIARPAFVYGPGDMHKFSMFKTVAAGKMILVNHGISRLHPAFVDDVVEGLLLAAERAPGSGETYIIAGDSPATICRLVTEIAGALGVPAPKISMPDDVLIPLAFAAEMMGRVVGKEPPLTRSRVKLLSENYAYSIDKARRELGFKPVVDLAQGVRLTAEWYRERGLL